MLIKENQRRQNPGRGATEFIRAHSEIASSLKLTVSRGGLFLVDEGVLVIQPETDETGGAENEAG